MAPPWLTSLWRLVPRVGAQIGGGLSLVSFVVWALTGAGSFWPAYVWISVWFVLAMIVAWRWSRLAPPGPRRDLETQGAFSLVLCVNSILQWSVTGAGSFWPAWVILGFTIAFVVHWAYLRNKGADLRSRGERELTARVETLTETRRGALDVQAAELRRIERDLHDGAQARLVALSMQLGRAEEGLADRPEIAALVRQARAEATAANAELRDLARGIAPPVLADRGLAAAVEALAGRSPVPVTVDARLGRRPAPVIESAAYFVVAESLTNVAKHAPGARAAVTIRLDGDDLDVVVADDGPGGADLAAGSGLDGLRRRVAALDGEMEIASPAGEGTRIEVRLPCGS
ncbi:MAG: histidine kinase [Actinobacteria bacterium]|nr:histidine kinase [Actinomycetota bacterium]